MTGSLEITEVCEHYTNQFHSRVSPSPNDRLMLTIDGSRYSGSGTIVRQAVAFSALTGQGIHVVNARAKRDKPGLRPQHIRVVEAIGELVNGHAEGLTQGSQEFTFRPGSLKTGHHYSWDIGSAGSTTMLGLGILPVLAFAGSRVMVELRGGLFQDFAPSVFHLQHIIIPMLEEMGLHAEVEIVRPGYVPRGDGILRLAVKPLTEPFRAITKEEVGPVTRVWGIALSSHLEERRVSQRMADAARDVLAKAGHQVEIEVRNDTKSMQAGAALALFADEGKAVHLGADQAGALRRRAESIGKHVAKQLLDELMSGATLDRFAADQIILFAALAAGESRFIIPTVTDHVLTSVWLAEIFLDAHVRIDGQRLAIHGMGFWPNGERTPS
jgi:RNA 3'-phosphate cyclase